MKFPVTRKQFKYEISQIHEFFKGQRLAAVLHRPRRAGKKKKLLEKIQLSKALQVHFHHFSTFI
jgi:hypothetical protein